MERRLKSADGHILESTYEYIEHELIRNIHEVDVSRIPSLVRQRDEEGLAALFAASVRTIPELTDIRFDHIFDCAKRVSRFLLMSGEFQELGNITNGQAESHHGKLEVLRMINRMRRGHNIFFRAIIDRLLSV